MNTSPRLRRMALLAGLAVLPVLQGCVPVLVGGAGMTAIMASDRRTSGAQLEDEGIEWKTSSRINEKIGDRIHFNVTSFNRNVLLTGEAPNEAIKAEAERLAATVPNVRGLTNEIRVAPSTTLSSRSNDTMLTSQIKARFVDQATFGVQHIKVVTEAGTAFLLGMVTQREADAATEIARTTAGVRKVVRVFEYISEDEARRLDKPNNQPMQQKEQAAP